MIRVRLRRKSVVWKAPTVQRPSTRRALSGAKIIIVFTPASIAAHTFLYIQESSLGWSTPPRGQITRSTHTLWIRLINNHYIDGNNNAQGWEKCFGFSLIHLIVIFEKFVRVDTIKLVAMRVWKKINYSVHKNFAFYKTNFIYLTLQSKDLYGDFATQENYVV